MRVMPHQSWLEIDARETRPLYRKVCDLLVAQAQLQRHRLEARTAVGQFLEARDVLGINQLHCGKSLQRVVDVSDLFGNQFQLVGRQVLGQHAALAIEDQPANRRHGLDAVAIALRLLGEQFVVDDLQLHEPRDHTAQQQKRNRRGHRDARDEQATFGVMVLDG